MKTPCLIGFALVVGLSSSACGTGTVASDNGDGGRKDGEVASGYTYVAIIDVEKQQKGDDFSCSADKAPGSEIDAVALIRKGEIVGHGLVGSALYSKSTVEANQCKDDDCPDGKCKYTEGTAAEGPPNAEIKKDGDDKGYLSLNGGTLQIRIGNKDGKEPGQDIRSGDQIKVFEVDQTKKTDSNGCACAPEKYHVVLQKGQDNLTLRPSQFDKANTSVCGASPSSDSQLGCGTTVFDVP
jgi:hypothetical protein